MNTPKSQNPEGKVVAWQAHYIGGDGKPKTYTTSIHELAVENDADGNPVPLIPATALADMQRRLKELAAVWEKDWPGDKSPNHAAMRTAAAHCANELRLLLRGDGGHDSDCATHNEPAMSNGPCDCSAADTRRLEVLDAMLRTCDPEDLPYFQGGQWRAMIGPKEFGFNTLRDVADALRGDGKGEGVSTDEGEGL